MGYRSYVSANIHELSHADDTHFVLTQHMSAIEIQPRTHENPEIAEALVHFEDTTSTVKLRFGLLLDCAISAWGGTRVAEHYIPDKQMGNRHIRHFGKVRMRLHVRNGLR
jgi:hypothetical protein